MTPTPDDVGSPYAIGSSEGGHDAIHPALGTIDDFRQLREAAAAHGMEIALDFAIQCSPDHPGSRSIPNGSIGGLTARCVTRKIRRRNTRTSSTSISIGARPYPALWNALRDIVLFWCDEGVRIFRVDNPHTKPLPFWEWLIAQLRAASP